MTTYTELDLYLGKKQDRPYGNNTRVQRRGKSIAIKHFDTDIMLFSENEIVMDCQGWRSATTKSRLNDNLPSPWMVCQEKGVWYLQEGWNNETSYVFKDGITITFGGGYGFSDYVSGSGNPNNIKKLHKLSRQINKYAKNYVKELVNGNVPAPSNGDCWGCLLKDENGKTALGNDHLISHMDENYYVPSLLMNAIDEFALSHIALWYIQGKWNVDNQENMDFCKDVFERQAKSSIVRYMKRQLKLAA